MALQTGSLKPRCQQQETFASKTLGDSSMWLSQHLSVLISAPLSSLPGPGSGHQENQAGAEETCSQRSVDSPIGCHIFVVVKPLSPHFKTPLSIFTSKSYFSMFLISWLQNAQNRTLQSWEVIQRGGARSWNPLHKLLAFKVNLNS